MYSEKSREGGTQTKSSPFLIADGHTDEKSREGGKMEYAARGGLLFSLWLWTVGVAARRAGSCGGREIYRGGGIAQQKSGVSGEKPEKETLDAA